MAMLVRRRRLPPYVEKIPLARRRKADSWLVTSVEVTLLLGALAMGLFVYYRSHDLPFYAAKIYAHLGSSEAQSALSEYYLRRRHEHPDHAEKAEHWLKRAAESGHSMAAYNLAVAHLRGDLPSSKDLDDEKDRDAKQAGRKDIHGLLNQAVKGGVHEALGLLHLCGHGQCVRRSKIKTQ